MDTATLLESFKTLLSEVASRPFGTWQFWTVSGVGLVIVLIFGKVLARGIGKSEKSVITVFIGNALCAALALIVAWAFLYFTSPYIQEVWLAQLLAGIIAGIVAILFTTLLGPLFWSQGRAAAVFACLFALALGYGALFATDKVLDIFESGSAEVQNYQKEQKDALPE
ncbi:hypothetical protein [Rubellicoccus peritrichatus]|uniref:Uncharacterized protein n=1 Tax=Rubellicoccus peritrichatus TaxID=3080537 RepID=A0AAQ3QUK5_9BACT|nr:hypothetical protein [Puniceicoccus sp. CR14]WOO39827.1 hypothetical protein RZN69_14475 [Puniceicoccus sp. CR14]